MIDGGRGYMRAGCKPDQKPIHLRIELVGGLTAEALAVNASQAFGVIKTRNLVYDVLYRYTLNQDGKLYRYPKTK